MSSCLRLRAPWLWLAAGVLSATVGAQPATPPQPVTPAPTPEPTLEKVTVTERNGYDPRKDDTASKTVVQKEELTRFGDVSLGDALKRLPGVSVSSSGAIALRGMGNYTQILLNGDKPPAGFTLDSLTPDMVERVEIIRSATADLRTEGIAGTINIILRAVPKKALRQLDLTHGRQQAQHSSSLGWRMSDQAGVVNYNLNLNLTHRTYQWGNQSTETATDALGTLLSQRWFSAHAPGSYDQINLTPSADIKLPGGDTLNVQAFVFGQRSQRSNDVFALTLSGAPPTYSRTAQTWHGWVGTLRSDFTWKHEWESGTKLSTKLSLNAFRRLGDSREQGFDAADLQKLDDSTLGHGQERSISSNGKYTVATDDSHTLALGWDGSRAVRHEDRFQRQAQFAGVTAINSDLDFTARIQRLALYAQDEWNITPRWSVYYGLRWEEADLRGAGPGFAEVHNRVRLVSPVAQTLWKWPGDEGHQVRLALNRSFNVPNINAIIPRPFITTNNTSLNPDFVGNPALQPERALGLDLSFEWYFKGGGNFTASTYVRHLDDLIHSDVSLVNGRWVAMQTNNGTALKRGLELDSKWPLQALWSQAPAVELRMGLGRHGPMLRRLPGRNTALVEGARWSATAGADYRINARWSAGSSFKFNSAVNEQTSPNQINTGSPGREWDAFVLWTAVDGTKLRISGANLLAQKGRWTSRYFNDAGSLINDDINPSFRSIRASLELHY